MMLHALVCDAPAKAFVLCTKGHPDFFCCSKCIVKGKHENRVCYPDIRQELRTDQSFRDKAQEEQHAGFHATGFQCVFMLPEASKMLL